VPDTFVVRGPAAAFSDQHPARGVAFDGTRQNIAVGDVIRAMGRRTPDDTVAQRRFRFAFILVTAPGADPSAADLAQLEGYRQQFAPFFFQASSGLAQADASLRRSLKLSLFPAAGVVAGGAGTATLTVATPPSLDLPVTFQAVNGDASFPATVTLRAGATTVGVPYRGITPGVEEVTATPADPRYETAFARVQVAGAAQLQLILVSRSPIFVRLTDANGLAYPGARIVASASPGGSVLPAAALTDAAGQAVFAWASGAGAAGQLRLAVDGIPAVSLTLWPGRVVPGIPRP
jgi:hypothetical protein